MSEFENATPRPWMKDKYGNLRSSNGELVAVYDLGASIAMTSPAEEERDNAALIIRAVNAHAALASALAEVMGWISNWDPNFIYDDEWSETQQKVDAALKLARGDQ